MSNKSFAEMMTRLEEITKILINNGWAISLIETKEYIEDPNSLSPNTMFVIGKKI